MLRCFLIKCQVYSGKARWRWKLIFFLNDWWCSRRRKIRRIKLSKGNNLTLFFNTKTFYTHDGICICYLWFPLFLLYKYVINFYFVHSYNLLVLFLHTLKNNFSRQLKKTLILFVVFVCKHELATHVFVWSYGIIV